MRPSFAFEDWLICFGIFSEKLMESDGTRNGQIESMGLSKLTLLSLCEVDSHLPNSRGWHIPIIRIPYWREDDTQDTRGSSPRDLGRTHGRSKDVGESQCLWFWDVLQGHGVIFVYFCVNSCLPSQRCYFKIHLTSWNSTSWIILVSCRIVI